MSECIEFKIEKDDHLKDVLGRPLVSIRKLYDRLINGKSEYPGEELYIHCYSLLDSVLVIFRWHQHIILDGCSFFNMENSMLSRCEELKCFTDEFDIDIRKEPLYKDDDESIIQSTYMFTITKSLNPDDIEKACSEWYNKNGSDTNDIELFLDSEEPTHKSFTLVVEGVVYQRVDYDKGETVNVHKMVQLPLTFELLLIIIKDILRDDKINKFIIPKWREEYICYYDECLDYIDRCCELLGLNMGSRVKSARKV